MKVTRKVFVWASAIALLAMTLSVPVRADVAVGGLVNLLSQDRQHELALQTRLAVTAKYGSEVIGAAHFGVVPSVTRSVSLEFLFTPDNFEFRDTREDFGSATLIPVSGNEVLAPITPVYVDSADRGKRQPAAFRFTVAKETLASGMAYSLKLRLNLAKSSRTFLVFFKRSTQKGDNSFSLNVRKPREEPRDAVEAFRQLDGFSALIDVDDPQEAAMSNRNDEEVANLREQVTRLTDVVESLRNTRASNDATAPANPAPANNQERAKPAEEAQPPKPTLKAYAIVVQFRNADGTAILPKNGEAKVSLNGQEYRVQVVGGKGQITIDLDPSRDYAITTVMRLRTQNGWSGWSTSATDTAKPSQYDRFETACNWAARRS